MKECGKKDWDESGLKRLHNDKTPAMAGVLLFES
jgi:hypothetical protein